MKIPTKIYAIGGALIIGYFLFKKTTTKKIKKLVLTQKQKDFVASITPSAKKIGDKIGVPYKFIIAQICLESGFGRSSLTTKYFNYGGIKAKKSEPGVELLTTECRNGVCAKEMQRFKIFPNAETGLNAQAVVYQNRYFKKHLNKTNDAKIYATLLQSEPIKYATDLNYVSKIHRILDAI
jgi:flagellum-specific peptidoglycan hydrolase FlgJ